MNLRITHLNLSEKGKPQRETGDVFPGREARGKKTRGRLAAKFWGNLLDRIRLLIHGVEYKLF